MLKFHSLFVSQNILFKSTTKKYKNHLGLYDKQEKLVDLIWCLGHSLLAGLEDSADW